MDYTTVFDVSQQPFPWSIPAPAFFASIGALLLTIGVSRGIMPTHRFTSIRTQVFLGYIGAFVFFFTACLLFANARHDYIQCQNASLSTKQTISEGLIEDFTPGQYNKSADNRPETFTVQGQRFTYGRTIQNTCFNHISSDGGPLREGLFVRIHHVGQLIVRIDVKSGDS